MRARIRTIKPEVFHDEHLWMLAETTGHPILQGFAGLWCYADREGRFEWRPMALQALILPYWRGSFGQVLDALEGGGFIRRYEVDGREYGLVVNFKKHQAINAREPASTLPEPPPDTARARTCTHVGKGREGKGTEGEGNGAHGATLPPPVDDRTRENCPCGLGSDPLHPPRWCGYHVQIMAAEQANQQGQTIPATYHTLDGWELSAELRAAALMAGVPDIDERVAAARALRIAAPHGTTDRDKWVRAQFPRWRRWREQDQAKQSISRGPAPPPVEPIRPRRKERDHAVRWGYDIDAIFEAVNAEGWPARAGAEGARREAQRRMNDAARNQKGAA